MPVIHIGPAFNDTEQQSALLFHYLSLFLLKAKAALRLPFECEQKKAGDAS